MRLGWIAVCALAVIGGFLFVLRIAWLLGLQETWLPYPAHLLGAVLAGWVLARQGRVRSWLEPAIGGLAAIVVVAIVSLATYDVFDSTVSRASWLLGITIALASAGAAALGAWFADPGKGPPGLLSITTLATFVTTALLLFGVRLLVAALKLYNGWGWPLVFVCVIGALGGFVTQLVVPRKSVWACSFGLCAIILIQLVDYVVHRHHSIRFTEVLALAVDRAGARWRGDRVACEASTARRGHGLRGVRLAGHNAA